MAYRVPNFNLNVNLWRRPALVTAVPTRSFLANLSPGRRVELAAIAQTQTTMAQFFTMELLCPKLTDITGIITTQCLDCVEVPAGSGRYYAVASVDDVGKGFANEYRLAHIYQLTSAMMTLTTNPWGVPAWPLPIP